MKSKKLSRIYGKKKNCDRSVKQSRKTLFKTVAIKARDFCNREIELSSTEIKGRRIFKGWVELENIREEVGQLGHLHLPFGAYQS